MKVVNDQSLDLGKQRSRHLRKAAAANRRLMRYSRRRVTSVGSPSYATGHLRRTTVQMRSIVGAGPSITGSKSFGTLRRDADVPDELREEAARGILRAARPVGTGRRCGLPEGRPCMAARRGCEGAR